jgi:hypothetical protein
MYTEPESIHNINRLSKIFLESYPENKDQIELFVRWIYSQYGYQYLPKNTTESKNL